MKRIIGLTCIVAGIFMVGVGSYCSFEIYDRYLKSTSTSLYRGEYVFDSRTITINDSDDDELNASIEGNTYIFSFDGNVYKTKNSSNYIIKFNDDELILYIGDQEEGIIFKKIKN